MNDEDGNAKDRAATEQIIGTPLPDEWPANALSPGQRVRIVQDVEWDGPWAREFHGVVSDMAAPQLVRNPKAHLGELSYWVEFDEPERQRDGSGPYRKAQICSRYVVSEDPRQDGALGPLR